MMPTFFSPHRHDARYRDYTADDLAECRSEAIRVQRDDTRTPEVSSGGRCNAMDDHAEEGSWVAFVGHACR